MPIVPDTKDWTWVLERPCPECGFDASALDHDRVPSLIRENAGRWRLILEQPGVVLRRRPSEDRWSALEYACHVRDVFRLYRYRLGLMLEHEDPTFPNWDQDESAVAESYNDQDPARVRGEVEEAAAQLAVAFDGLVGAQWSRTGTRSDGARFTVDSFARYMIHDPIHHLHDVTEGLAQSGAAER